MNPDHINDCIAFSFAVYDCAHAEHTKQKHPRTHARGCLFTWLYYSFSANAREIINAASALVALFPGLKV